MSFADALDRFKRVRAVFVQRKVLKYEFELFVDFERHTRHIWALYQQAVVGDINVPSLGVSNFDTFVIITELNYMEVDEGERSWMWRWINGNEKWHAWNKLRGMSKEEATEQYIQQVNQLELEIEDLRRNWWLKHENGTDE